MFTDLLARIFARRLVRWSLVGLFNLIGFTSVVGIPVALIVDALLLLVALQGVFAGLRVAASAALAAGNVAGKLASKAFKVAAAGTAVCAVVGVAAAIAIPRLAPSHSTQAIAASSATTQATAPVAEAGATPVQPAAQADAVTPSVGPRELIALIDAHDYAGALALIEAGADLAAPAEGRTPLTALEVDNPPDYYGSQEAYRLMKKLVATSGGLDRRLDDFGAILWHRLMYRLQNNPEKFAEVLDILLARGVDINQMNFHSQTLADTQMWSYAVQDIMIAHGACVHFPNPAKPHQLICAGKREET